MQKEAVETASLSGKSDAPLTVIPTADDVKCRKIFEIRNMVSVAATDTSLAVMNYEPVTIVETHK